MDTKYLSKVNQYMCNKKESIVVNPIRYKETNGFESQYERAKLLSVMLCNLHDLGYTIPKDEFPKLMSMSANDLNQFIYQPVLNAAKEAKGAHVTHRLLFPGFPESVRNLDIDTLSNIRFASYFTSFVDKLIDVDPLADSSITRNFVERVVAKALNQKIDDATLTNNKDISNKEFIEKAQGLLTEKTNNGNSVVVPRQIHIVDEQDYFNMVKNMLSARTSLSEYDKEIVMFTVDNFNKDDYTPSKIQFKETQALLDKYNFQHRYFENINIQNMKDMNRLIASLSDKDVSLNKKEKMNNFSNKDRKALYEIFHNAIEKNRFTMLETSVSGYMPRFIQNVIENRLHLNDKKMDKDGVVSKFIKESKKHKNIMSIYERNIMEHKYDIAAKVLSRYSPTLALQRAREIVGKSCAYYGVDTNSKLSDEAKLKLRNIEQTLKEAAKMVDVGTLLSTINEASKEYKPYKIMTPKGPTNDLIIKENKSIHLSKTASDAIISIAQHGMNYQIKNNEMNGKIQIEKGTRVYIDPSMDKIPIPTVGRTDIQKNRSLPTGSRVPVNPGNIMRAALFKQNKQHQFIDFSTGFLDENYKLVGQVSWNGLILGKDGNQFAYHSGDTAMCEGKGCTEIIDINIPEIKKNFPQARYAVYTAIMYSGTPLNSCDQLFIALAPTEYIGHGKDKEAYVPSSVQFKLDITGESSCAMPILYDIKTNEVLVMNLELKDKSRDWQSAFAMPRHFELPAHCEALENYSSSMALKVFAANQHTEKSIGTLAKAYAEQRGAIIVDKPGLADVAFVPDRTEIQDERPVVDGINNPDVVHITPFDKDLITAELIPNPKEVKAIVKERKVQEQLKGMVKEQEEQKNPSYNDNFEEIVIGDR